MCKVGPISVARGARRCSPCLTENLCGYLACLTLDGETAGKLRGAMTDPQHVLTQGGASICPGAIHNASVHPPHHRQVQGSHISIRTGAEPVPANMRAQPLFSVLLVYQKRLK